MTIYDISQTLRERIAVWPGDQKFRLRWSMQLSRGHACNVSAITMSVHTGTHLDAPFHFDANGTDIGTMDLEPYVGPARVVEVPRDYCRIDAPYLEGLAWDGVRRVLFRTGASELDEEHFHRDYLPLTVDAAGFLGRLGLRLVGTDAPSVDAFESKQLTCHKRLLQSGIAILEGVRLGHVPPGDYELICLPLKLAGLDGSPVRAVLRK